MFAKKNTITTLVDSSANVVSIFTNTIHSLMSINDKIISKVKQIIE